jgi:hypothetical protein
VRIRSVTVGPDTVEAHIAFETDEPLRTSAIPGAASRMLALLPGLRGHRCDNADGRSFADELADTEIAHVLEHAALEVMALAGSPDTLRGDTSWDFARDGRGVFRVRLQYDDDRVCIGAIKLAGELVNAMLAGAEPPDIRVQAARLRALRRK